ncbi:MAG: TetR/AcrR family transcriptional regulator [Mycobacteriaceae bacterium]|nr:TetR/AcrR family transcriptional regulator [Mycobacteriaceae bacterium]
MPSRLVVSQRRSLLVEAAFRVIARGGIEAATTRAICAEAGMAQSSFHYAFDSRDELLAAVVTRGASDALAAATAPVAPPAQPPSVAAPLAELLRAGLRGYLDSVAADPGREQALLTLNLYAQRTPGLESFAQQMYAQYYDVAEQALAGIAAAARIQWTLPPRALAPVLVSATDGLTQAWLATRDAEVAERLIAAAVMMLSGFATTTEEL